MKHIKKLFNYKNNGIDYSKIKFDENFNPGLSLRRLREEFDIKQVDIYEDRNIEQSYISNVEKGKRYPDIDILLIYAEELKLDYFDILSAILNDYKDFLLKESEKIDSYKKSLKKSIDLAKDKLIKEQDKNLKEQQLPDLGIPKAKINKCNKRGYIGVNKVQTQKIFKTK